MTMFKIIVAIAAVAVVAMVVAVIVMAVQMWVLGMNNDE